MTRIRIRYIIIAASGYFLFLCLGFFVYFERRYGYKPGKGVDENLNIDQTTFLRNVANTDSTDPSGPDSDISNSFKWRLSKYHTEDLITLPYLCRPEWNCHIAHVMENYCLSFETAWLNYKTFSEDCSEFKEDIKNLTDYLFEDRRYGDPQYYNHVCSEKLFPNVTGECLIRGNTFLTLNARAHIHGLRHVGHFVEDFFKLVGIRKLFQIDNIYSPFRWDIRDNDYHESVVKITGGEGIIMKKNCEMVCFERTFSVQRNFHHFLTTEDSQEFAQGARELCGLPRDRYVPSRESGEKMKVTFINRQKGKSRFIPNIETIEQFILKEFLENPKLEISFESEEVVMESFCSQVEYFSSSDILFISQGSGLVDHVFMHPYSVVVSVCDTHSLSMIFKANAGLMKLNYLLLPVSSRNNNNENQKELVNWVGCMVENVRCVWSFKPDKSMDLSPEAVKLYLEYAIENVGSEKKYWDNNAWCSAFNTSENRGLDPLRYERLFVGNNWNVCVQPFLQPGERYTFEEITANYLYDRLNIVPTGGWPPESKLLKVPKRPERSIPQEDYKKGVVDGLLWSHWV